jgi:hypothetical protein
MGQAFPRHRWLAGAGDDRQAGVQGRGNLAAAPSCAGLAGIGLQHDAGLGQPPRRVCATMDHALKPLPLIGAELHDILLHSDLFHHHEAAPSLRYGAIASDIPLTVNDRR